MSPTRARFAEVVRSEPVDVGLACLLIGGEVDRDLDVDASLETLERLAAGVRAQLASPRAGDAAEALRRVLGGEHGFAGTPEDYDDVRASLLHEVLRRGRGPADPAVGRLDGGGGPRWASRPTPSACPGTSSSGWATPTTSTCWSTRTPAASRCRRDDVAELVLRAAPAAGCRPELLRPMRAEDLLLRVLNNVRRARGPPPAGAGGGGDAALGGGAARCCCPATPCSCAASGASCSCAWATTLAARTSSRRTPWSSTAPTTRRPTAARREARLARAQLN